MTNNFNFVIKIDNNKLLLCHNNKNLVVSNQYINELVKVMMETEIAYITKENNLKDIKIVYKNGQGEITIKNFHTVFRLKEFVPIKEQYSKFKEKYDCKITRTNKFVGKRIAITTSLIAILTITGLSNIQANDLKNAIPTTSETSSVSTDFLKNNYIDKIKIPISNDQVNVLINNETNNNVVVSSNEIKNKINLKYIDNSNSQKLNNVETNYENTIKKYAQKYGFDYNLILAICTQERGTHSTVSDDTGGLGIMQIQVDAHKDGSQIPTTVFNELNEPMESNFTFNKEKYKSLDGNIEAGCALLRYYTNLFNGNIIAGIYAYNTGEGNIGKTVNSYANDLGIARDAVLSDINHNYWAKYLSDDQYKYLPMVMQYYKGNELSYYIVNKNADNKIKATKTSLEINNILEEETKKTR